jgi:hypothetical protein
MVSTFAVVFGLASVFVSGPAGIAIAAGALGLSFTDAVMQTEDYFAEGHAANTALDPSQALMSSEDLKSWGWLVVAWAGVVMDAKAVGEAIHAVKAAGGAIEPGVKLLSKSDEEVAKRLRLAAGYADVAEKVTEANRGALANRLGTTLELVEDMGREVKVVAEMEKGVLVVKGTKYGPLATAHDVLMHIPTVQMVRRYEGLLGRLRSVLDRFLEVAGVATRGGNPFPVGSAAFESYGEAMKLDLILAARREQLGKMIGTEGKAALERDIVFLESELGRHESVVAQMVVEKGAGFIAVAEEQTAKAIKQGMPALEGDTLIKDASQYYYRANPHGEPPFIITRIANSDAPSRTLVREGASWKIAEGALSRAEEAAALVKSWPDPVRKAFQKLEAELGTGAFRVVPLEAVASTRTRIGQIMTAERRADILDILTEAFKESKAADPAKSAAAALERLSAHEMTVVRGTDQLRAFGYRRMFLQGADAGEDEIHHLIPLYLGGDHKTMVKLNPDLHDRLHAAIDEIIFAPGTSLAPTSMQRAKGLSFSQGAAVIDPKGGVQFARCLPDGTYVLIP